MIFILGIVGSLFIGCLYGVVVLEKPWVRIAMLLLFGFIAFLVLSAYHHAELGKQRAIFSHKQKSKEQTEYQATDVNVSNIGSFLFSCNYEGKYYLTKMSAEQYYKIPTWHPDRTPNPPLAPAQALKEATKVLEALLPNRKWETPSVHLAPLCPQTKDGKWVYKIQYTEILNTDENVKEGVTYSYRQETFVLIVTMYGECLLPSVEERKKANPAP